MLTVFVLVAFLRAADAQLPKSCADIVKSNVQSSRGEYTIYNNNDQPFQVFCDFHHGYGYTYISPSTTVVVDTKNLYTDDTHVLIRDRRTDGTQYEATISQISAFKHLPLTILDNASTGFQTIQNAAMSPYIYLGFIPKNLIHAGQTEGYNLNGQDITFTNCDGNGNSYFAFLFNHNNAAPSSYHPVYTTLQKKWADGANLLAASQYLPESYFSFFEMHFGGCGAYGTPQHFSHVTGAALGLRYDIKCPTPVDVAHSVKVFNSTFVDAVVTYTCDVGYTLMGGDLTRKCDVTGRWTGAEPNCGSFPCDSHPCQNGGLCFEVEGATYVCECIGGYGGKFCETPL